MYPIEIIIYLLKTLFDVRRKTGRQSPLKYKVDWWRMEFMGSKDESWLLKLIWISEKKIQLILSKVIAAKMHGNS